MQPQTIVLLLLPLLARASQLEQMIPPLRQRDIPPFQVTDFYVQVYPALINSVWEYWVEANVTVQPGEGSAWCYAWANTSSPTTLDNDIPPTACTQDSAISWWFDPPVASDNASSWTYGVAWNESEMSVLTGLYSGPASDFGLGTTTRPGNSGNLTLMYFAGDSSFSMPVTQSTKRRMGRRSGMYAAGMQRLS